MEPSSTYTPVQTPAEVSQTYISNQASYSGMFHRRIGRLGFFLGFLYLIAAFLIPVIAYAAFNLLGGIGPESIWTRIMNIFLFLFSAILIIAVFPITFSLYIRRLHDVNQSGLLSLLALLAPVSLFLYMYLQVVPSNNANNTYGPEVHDNSPLVVLGLKKPTH